MFDNTIQRLAMVSVMVMELVLWPYRKIVGLFRKQTEKWNEQLINRRYPRVPGFRFTTIYFCSDIAFALLQFSTMYHASTVWNYWFSVFFSFWFLMFAAHKAKKMYFLYTSIKQMQKEGDEFQYLDYGIPTPVLKAYIRSGYDPASVEPGTECNPILYFRKECSWRWSKVTVSYRTDDNGTQSPILDTIHAKLDFQTLPSKRAVKEDSVFEQLKGNHIEILRPNDLWTS